LVLPRTGLACNVKSGLPLRRAPRRNQRPKTESGKFLARRDGDARPTGDGRRYQEANRRLVTDQWSWSAVEAAIDYYAEDVGLTSGF
jgi:hypothetical protein